MKRVLMTNLYFSKYTGSELHILEMARLFEKKGYEVVIVVFQKAYPLLEKAGTIRVIECLSEELEHTDFDIVFVQHYPVFDYLCCKYCISYNKLIVSKLSVISELEYLPVCTPEADLILCVSEECANEVYKQIGVDSRVKIFKNSVSQEYFEGVNKKVQLKKIAIISNHVPQELIELSQLMRGQYTIDYIGVEYSPRLVDAELLKEYDLVITIGRTVQQCFALKVPVYVYDNFGGPGYITDDNFLIAEKSNFSGRGGFSKKTSTELNIDIIKNYENNLLNLDKLNSIAKKEYSYDVNFERIFQQLMATESREKKNIDYYTAIEKKRVMLYSKVIPAYALSPNIISQLYMDFGNGFNEQDSVKWNASANYIITKIITIDKKVNCLRFDPCQVPAECYISELCINGKIKTEYSQRKESFLDFDPQFMIDLSEEEQRAKELRVEIKYKFKPFDWLNTVDMYKDKMRVLENSMAASKDEMITLREIIEKSENEISTLQHTIEAIREYYKITPKNIINRTVQFCKRKLNFTKD